MQYQSVPLWQARGGIRQKKLQRKDPNIEPGTTKYNDVGCLTEDCGALERWEEMFLPEWCQAAQSYVV
jgi:hypothetical protein